MATYVRIPKGTLVYSKNCENWGDFKFEGKPSAREMVVEAVNTGTLIQAREWGSIKIPPELDGQMCVSWSGGEKIALLSDVEVGVPEPVKKAPKLSLRQQMVKGSRWRLTQPATVIKPGNPTPMARGYVQYEPVPDYDLPAGTEVGVTGKFATSITFNNVAGVMGWAWFSGLYVPIKVNGKALMIEFKELNKSPELLGEAPKTFIYAIFDTAEGEYYSGYDYVWNRGGLSPITYEPKLTKAKKFKRLADARVHCLIQTGYYDNLPESWGQVPDWMCGRKVFDVPDTWVIHKIDKATKQVDEVIELVDTFKRSWRLRELTVQYGSAVRAVYADLEKKGKLGEYTAVMMFKADDPDRRWYGAELTKQEIDDINTLIKNYGYAAKIVKTKTGFAIALPDEMTATMMCLAYQGSLKSIVIDFATMSAKVGEKALTTAPESV